MLVECGTTNKIWLNIENVGAILKTDMGASAWTDGTTIVLRNGDKILLQGMGPADFVAWWNQQKDSEQSQPKLSCGAMYCPASG